MLIQDQFIEDRRRLNIQSETKEKTKDVQNTGDVWNCRFIPVTAQAQIVGVAGFSEV